jgi:hypothetical protein
LIYLLRTTCKTILESSILHPLWVFVSTLLTGKNNRDALIKAYFDHVSPFAPVIDRADFIRGYQSGDCSLFLLRVILTPASLHVPADVLSACGFASRLDAQESFFSKAKLLHDFAVKDDPLVMLQGSIILSMVILDHPTDRDFGYWFHNAIRLATKLDLRSTCVSYSLTEPCIAGTKLTAYGLSHRCVREDKPRKVLKLYRRIWWALYVRPSSRHRVLFFLLYA